VLSVDSVIGNLNIVGRREKNTGGGRLPDTNQVAADETGRKEPEKNST